MKLLRDESGLSLPELLVATLVGMLVLYGALTILTASQHAQAKVSDRSESIARGRTAMEQLVQRLRSQVCIGSGAPAIIYGDDTHVTFYADLTNTYTGTPTANDFVPAKMDLSYSNGAVIERIYPGTPDTSKNATFPYTFSTTPSLTRAVIDKIALRTQGGVTVPLFKYYSFDDNDPIRPSNLLTTPLSAGDRDNVVQVTINYQSLPTRLNSPYPGEPFTADVFVRTADPTDPEHSPLCF